MTENRAVAAQERILVVAPTGRDAMVTRDVLGREGFLAVPCVDLRQVCAELAAGAGVLFLAEEALTPAGISLLSIALRNQPPWSDLPIILSTGAGELTEARVRAINTLDPSGNVTILERPIRVFTLLTTVHAALRARRRQYQMRDLHLTLQEQHDSLQSERDLRARFVSLLAHDLRGPVSAAMLASDVIIRTPEKLDQRRELGVRIKRNLERIDTMVRDLLDASRVQAGQPLPLRLDEAELTGIAQEVVEELNLLHPDRLRLETSGTLPGIWSAEELRRAIWNLATNAIKYGAATTPVTVKVWRHEGRARVAVHNEGPPLSVEDQRRLFQPFSRTHSAEASSQLGWGLGLTLVRGCAEAHGGKVVVESSVATGTTFLLDLPLDARPFQPRGEEPAVPRVVSSRSPTPLF